MRKTFAAILFAALLAPAASQAQPFGGMGEGPPMGGPGGPMMRGPMGPPLHPHILKKVGVTDEQLKQIDAWRYESQKERIDIRHEIAKARLEMGQLLKADAPDEGAVFAQVDKVGALEVRMKKSHLGLLLKIRKLLTPEQWKKLQAERPRHFMERRIIRRFGGEGLPPPPPPPAPPLPPPAP